MIDRRTALQTTGWGLLGLASAPALAQTAFAPRTPIVPINAQADRLMRITVCLRPFRAAGPRIEVERIAGRQVIHHYGHGGSGWSLSWGSAMQAVPLALQAGAREVAVVGAGAIGLTTALTAQRMGLKVVIYAAERFPDVRSNRATGTWSPFSRVAMEKAVDPGFAARWEVMARRSWAMHQHYLGRAGTPVEFLERFVLFDAPPGGVDHAISLPGGGTDMFVNYEERLADITPRNEPLGRDQHPFPVPIARRNVAMNFNVSALSSTLEQEFMAAGGRFEPMTLASPRDFARIKERVIFNCTGYGARALMGDTSIIPVRGQIAWLPPQPEVRYGVYYRNIGVTPRADGIVVQNVGATEAFGFNDANETPDPDAARASVEVIASLFRAV
ncbi:FAD-dependent oxidoreductase [Sandarakinorhabdus sp. AAP62]|uniref:FAD-dependent oxidoreductase n=1 Tax=Sandarakinorhabdus sp. AAP62 TaxID=1248916 RepID=UPI0002DE5329|nr:FAD-dependent oxidoreductase [Sandarakinorhabdus sp. AAP62]